MSDHRLAVKTVPDLAGPPLAERNRFRTLPATAEVHAALFDAWPLLSQVEVGGTPHRAGARGSLRVAAWNAERGKYVTESARLLGGLSADVSLLSELDIGMARSGQRHALRDLAAELGQGYAFGVEFIETSVGDDREAVWHAGQENERGLHGGGLMSALRLHRPALARLDRDGLWWTRRFMGQARIGGRIAVLAGVELDGVRVTVVAPHIESHTTPQHRGEQMSTLLDCIDAYAPDAPVVIGGDLNTNTLGGPGYGRVAERARLVQEAPDRLCDPVPHEPMFAIARARGYDWTACNLAGAATQRSRSDGTPAPPFGKLDWFLTRGLDAGDPCLIEAVDGHGAAISDHEIIAVTVRLRGP